MTLVLRLKYVRRVKEGSFEGDCDVYIKCKQVQITYVALPPLTLSLYLNPTLTVMVGGLLLNYNLDSMDHCVYLHHLQ